MNKSKKIWAGIGLLAIVGGIAMLIAGGLSSNVVYFLTPSELRAELAERADEIVDQPLRLGGQVKAGSLTWDAEALDLRFVVADSLGEVFPDSHGLKRLRKRDLQFEFRGGHGRAQFQDRFGGPDFVAGADATLDEEFLVGQRHVKAVPRTGLHPA